jgi:hypothetical protein
MQSVGDSSGLGAARGRKLAENVRYMDAGSFLADEESLGDLAVAVSRRE